MSVHRDIATAAEDLLRALTVVDERVAAMRDAMLGAPGAQRFDTSGSASVLWCDVHEQEVWRCEEAGDDCDGETIELHDPTGEAAMRVDRGAMALRRLERLGRRLRTDARAYVDELARWGGKPSDDRTGVGECTDCKRYADGRTLRLSNYKTTGEPVCPSCRARRDRAA